LCSIKPNMKSHDTVDSDWSQEPFQLLYTFSYHCRPTISDKQASMGFICCIKILWCTPYNTVQQTSCINMQSHAESAIRLSRDWVCSWLLKHAQTDRQTHKVTDATDHPTDAAVARGGYWVGLTAVIDYTVNTVGLYIGWQWRNFFVPYLCKLTAVMMAASHGDFDCAFLVS